MSRLADALGTILADLAGERRPHAVVGGLAVSARTEPRFTRDVDLALSVPDDATAEALVASLGTRGYRVVAQVEQEQTGRLATVRLAPPGPRDDGLIVDLLFASSGIEPETVAEADVLEVVGGHRAPVARCPHLVVTKLLARAARRPQDDIDLVALRTVCGPDDVLRARQLAELVVARGFDRGRDLVGDVARWAAG